LDGEGKTVDELAQLSGGMSRCPSRAARMVQGDSRETSATEAPAGKDGMELGDSADMLTE